MMGATVGAATVIVKSDEPVPDPFMALSVATNVPAAAGVPVICPVLELMLKPVGRPVAP
jgi:hypothetical protein